MRPFHIKINNERGDDDQLYLLLTAKSPSPVTGITRDKAVKLSEFKKHNANMTICIDWIDAARLYVAYGEMDSAHPPKADGNQYFGWIEFTKKLSDSSVWINLSNVDIVGLPLILAGTASNGDPFTLGYKKSINDIVTEMKNDVLNGPTAPAVITCATGQTKIVGPNGMPDSYAPYEVDVGHGYLNFLMNAQANLIITSDSPKGGESKVFYGSFLNATSDDQPIISMKSKDGNLFQILKGQLTNEIIYRCDGGTLIYDGITYPQNRTKENDPGSTEAERTITNSTFRNILIGINEGYFTAVGENRSANFPYFSPFYTGEGSAYAKVLHYTSNSYGFPYADSNLKVLITANPSELLTMTIIKDDEAKGYDNSPPEGGNQPQSGDYQFGIGALSSLLGIIKIGNCRYLPNEAGAYGGFLPTVNDWIKMEFEGAGRHIWINPAERSDNGKGCFSPVDPFWDNKKLTWGAGVTWNEWVPSPPKPPV